MDEKVTPFGKECRKLRIDRGLNMTQVGKMLGRSQNQITQLELGVVNPSKDFIEKCIQVYEITESKERADFIAHAFASIKKLTLDLDSVTIIPKDDLVKLLAVLVFNLEPPLPNSKEWEAVSKGMERLNQIIGHRKYLFDVITE
jgi:transcriptional regulator with XRE-family HTH domain